MKSIRKSVLLEHSAEAIYALVEKVEDYPKFLPWCQHAQVHSRTAEGMEATVGIGLRGINQSFTTLNEHEPGRSIRLRLKSGPFSKLEGLWTFKPLTENACKVELALDYQFASTILENLVGPIFDPIAASLVDAFVQRADVVYGVKPPTTS